MCMYNKNVIVNNNEIGVSGLNIIKAGDVLYVRELKALKSTGWKPRPMAIIGNRQIDSFRTTAANCSVPAMMVTSSIAVPNAIPFMLKDRVGFIDTNNILSVNTKLDLDKTYTHARLTDAQLEMAKYMMMTRISGEKDPEIEEAISKYNREFLYAILRNEVKLNTQVVELDRTLSGMERFVDTYLGGEFSDDDEVKIVIREICEKESKSKTRQQTQQTLEREKRISTVVHNENKTMNDLVINTSTDMGKALSKALRGMVDTAGETVKAAETKPTAPIKTIITNISTRRPVYMIKDGDKYRLKRVREMADSEKSLFLTEVAESETFTAFAKKHNLALCTVNTRAKEVYEYFNSRNISLPQKVKVFMNGSSGRRGFSMSAENKRQRDLTMACCVK